MRFNDYIEEAFTGKKKSDKKKPVRTTNVITPVKKLEQQKKHSGTTKTVPSNTEEKQISQATKNWWNSHSEEMQKAHVKEHPEGIIAKLVASNKLKYGVKTDGSGPTGKVGPDGKVKDTEKSEEKPEDQTGTEQQETPLKKHLFSFDAFKLSGHKIEFDKETIKHAEKVADDIADVLDKKYHYGKSEPGSFGHETNISMAKYALNAIKNGEKDPDKIAAEVHRGWGAAVEEYYKDDEKEEINNIENNINEMNIFKSILLNEGGTPEQKKAIIKAKAEGYEYLGRSVWKGNDGNLIKIKDGKRKKLTDKEKSSFIDDSDLEQPRKALARTDYSKLPVDQKEKLKNIAKETISAQKKKKIEDKQKEEIKGTSKLKGTPASKPIIINGKVKTLIKTKTSKSDIWNKENSQTIENILKNNKNYQGEDISAPGNPYKIPDFVSKSDKFPKKYAQVIEAMMNTRTTGKGGFEPPISYFIKDSAGAGRINAQAGELLTMVSVSMSDDEFKDFKKSMIDHMDSTRDKNDTDFIINKDWIKAAENNRKAILNRISREYKTKDPSSLIVNTCWDTKEEVESMGMTDYDKNKGFSTDIYIKIRDKNGDELINEISLKKDKNVNFLNSGTGKLREWDKNLPKDADMGVYSSTQKDMLLKLDIKKTQKVLEQTMTPEVKEALEQMKKKKLTLEQVMEKPNREKKKILKLIHTALAAHGDEDSIKILDDLKIHEKKYQEAVIRELANNQKIKDKMLEEIRSEFPLKGVLDREETMAIGDMSVDVDTIKEIFKTDKWENIKESLKSYKGPPPFIGYEADTGKEIIPIAEIGIREDGTGYGGTWKFEMKMAKEFAKKLNEANKNIESSSKNESHVSRWLTDTDSYIIEKFRI